MKCLIILLILIHNFAQAQTSSVFDRNCEGYARSKKFIHPKSVLDVDKNTERYYFYDNLTPAYGKMVDDVNKFAPGYYKTPDRAPIHACPNQALTSCLPFQAYCTETIAKAAIREDLAEWKVVATNCQNPKYRARNPADHCQHDAIKQLQYVYDQSMILAKEEAKKNPAAARFFKEAAGEFGKYRDDMKALVAAQKKIDDAQKENLRQKALTKELAQAMKNCSDIVKEDDDDVQNRNLAGKIVAGLGCRDDLADLNQPQISKLKDDVDNILKHINTKVVLDQANSIALEKSATAFWASKRQLDGVGLESEASALKLICSEQPELCENQLSRKTLSDSYKKVAPKLKAVTPLSENETARLLQSEFNPLVDEINSYCRKTNAEFFKINREEQLRKEKDAPKHDPNLEHFKKVADNTRVEQKVRIEFVQGEMLLAAGRKTLQDKFSQLLDSKLGHLMMTKSLQEKVGIFNGNNFRAHCAGGDGKMLKHANLTDIKSAKAGFSTLLKDELEKVADSHDTGALGRKKALKTYLKNNPLTIAELLKKNPSPEYSKLMCYLIRDINSEDQNWEYAKTGVTVVGVVASVALAATGVGAPAGVALFAAVTTTTLVSAGASLDDYLEHKRDSRYALQSGATNQDSKTAAINRSISEDKKKDESFKDLAYTIVAEGVGFGATKILKVALKPGAMGARIANNADDVVRTENRLLVEAEHATDLVDDVARTPSANVTNIVDEAPAAKIVNASDDIIEEVPEAVVAKKPKTILDDKTLEPVDVVYDIPKGKTTVKVKRNSRLNLDDLADNERRFYDFIAANDPKIKRKIITSRASYTERMAQMHQNNNPKDMQYLLDNKKVVRFTRGGEADIYLNPSNKNEALKVWKPSRLDDFESSTRVVTHFEKKIDQNKNLSRVFAVSRVKEKGPNWIVKDFYPNSIEIGKVADPAELKKMNAAIDQIKKIAIKNPDQLDQRLFQNLLKKSDNIHWDAGTQKVILIDALGF